MNIKPLTHNCESVLIINLKELFKRVDSFTSLAQITMDVGPSVLFLLASYTLLLGAGLFRALFAQTVSGILPGVVELGLYC